MIVKCSGYFSEFHNKDTVRIKVPAYVVANTLNYADIKTYVVPIGTTWAVQKIDFINKKIVGKTFINIAGFEPFPVTHEFDFEEININLNRSVTFSDAEADLYDQTSSLLRSVLDNLFAYSDARDEFIKSFISTYVRYMPKLKSHAPWVDR